MTTYNLNAGDLLTLLDSTVTSTTAGSILTALVNNGEFPGYINSLFGVETQAGPPGGGLPAVADDTVSAGTKIELITIPTSQTSGTILTAPTAGALSPSEVFNFTNTVGGVVFVAGDQSVTINDLGTLGGDTLVGGAGFEKLVATGGANRLYGGSGANTLVAGSGKDTLVGGSGQNTLIGGGQSSLVAGSGNQKLIGGLTVAAHDTLIGGSGDDRLKVYRGDDSLVGGSGNTTLLSGIGYDTLVGSGNSRLLAKVAGHALLESSGNSTGHDTMKAFAGDNTILASAGDDRVVVGSSSTVVGSTKDTVYLGSGNNTVVSGNVPGSGLTSGDLTLFGGTGQARVVLGTGAVTDSIMGGAGATTVVSLESSVNLTSNSNTAVGGLHTLQFSDGQTIVINDANSNITIHFADGGTTNV
jgi:Ca2+-binding RTX toxin-like protein